jgi:hypothetical protein
MPNRHDRRRAAAAGRARVSDFGGIGSIEIVGSEHLLDLARASRSLAATLSRMARGRALCLTCDDYEFSEDDPPTLWALIKPPAADTLISGICERCGRPPAGRDLIGSAIKAMRRAGMVIRPVDYASLSAGGHA